jgi:hypothetical protein
MLKKHSILHALIRKYCGPAALATAALLLPGGNAAWAADEVFVSRVSPIVLPMGEKILAFDISFDDPVIELYLLADRTNAEIQAVRTDTNTLLTPYTANPPFAGAVTQNGVANNDLSGPDGVITVGHREIWAGDGPQNTGGVNPQPMPGTSTVKVIDLLSGKTTHVISTLGTFRADELCLDPRDGLVLVANDAEKPFPYVSLISTGSYSLLQQITFDGTVPSGSKIAAPKATNGIEQCQWDARTARFYLNIPEVNGPGDDTAPGAVVVLKVTSPGTIAIDKIFNIDHNKCAGPQGMVIGPDHQILLGCNAPSGKTAAAPNGNGNFSTVIIDDRNGKVIATLDNESGADQVWYNDGDGQYFLARSSAPLTQQLGVIDVKGDPSRLDQSVFIGTAGAAGNHSVAADPVFNQIYVPIASTSGASPTYCGGANGCIAIFTTTPGNDDPGIPAP